MLLTTKPSSNGACLVALALFVQGAFGQAAVDMAGAQAEAEGWRLAFADNFSRAELGNHWKPVRGNWSLSNGMLRAESGHIVCAWRFTGDVRLEYSAVADVEKPCDLSGVLSAKYGHESSGYYFGFGGQDNKDSFLIVQGKVVQRADLRIVPGKRYQVVCQREGEKITFSVSGKVVISYTHDSPVAKPGFDRVGLTVWAPSRFDGLRVYTKNDGKAIMPPNTRSKAKFVEVTGVEIEDPLFEELFSDKPTAGVFPHYGNKYDGRMKTNAISITQHQYAARRFGARYVLGEQLDEAAEYGIICFGRRDEPEYKNRGILTLGEVVQVGETRSSVSLPNEDLPVVLRNQGWIMDPRYLREMSRQVEQRARKNEFDFVVHFDELWTWHVTHSVPREKWYKQVEEADQEVRQKYGFGKYGMPISYAGGNPFERIAYARWASDKLTESFVNGYKAAKKINPDLKIIGPTAGSNATSGDMEAWSKGFDIYGGQAVGGQTNTLFDWVRPGGTTKLYVDLTDKPIWMMMHTSKRQMPVRDPEYLREVFSQIFRNGGEGLWLMTREFFELETEDAMIAEPFKWNAMLELVKVIREMRLPRLPRTADSAILFSSVSTITQEDGLSGDNHRHLSAYAALGPCLRNWFHFVSDRQIIRGTRDLGAYKTVIVPWATYEYPGVLDKFKDYVRGGGTLVVTDDSAFTWSISGEPFGAAWEDLSGVRRLEPRTGDAIMTVKATEHLALPEDFALSALVPGHRVEPVNEKVVTIAVFSNNDPAITLHPYGKGKVYYFAADPLYAREEWPKRWSTVAKGSAVVQLLGAIQNSAGVKAGHDIWRFKLPPYKTDVYRKESGLCLTNNYVYDVNEPLLEPNNLDVNGTYSYSRAPDAMPDVSATEVPFKTGHLTNRLSAFETRVKNRNSSTAYMKAETPKWVVAWKDPRPMQITFDLKSDQPLTQCRLIFSGAMPVLVVRGSTDEKDWTWLASTSEQVAGTRSDMLFQSGDPHDIRDVKDVRLYLDGSHRSGKGETGKLRADTFRYVRFDFARRKAKDVFELCEVDIWGRRTK